LVKQYLLQTNFENCVLNLHLSFIIIYREYCIIIVYNSCWFVYCNFI